MFIDRATILIPARFVRIAPPSVTRNICNLMLVKIGKGFFFRTQQPYCHSAKTQDWLAAEEKEDNFRMSSTCR